MINSTEIEQLVIATMEATGEMRRVSARVVASGKRYRVEVDGLIVHQSSSPDSAFGQMAHFVERKLERPTTFGLTVNCSTKNEGFVYGSMRGGGGGRPLDSMSRCWLRSQEDYDDSSLSAALRHAVDFLRKCCG